MEVKVKKFYKDSKLPIKATKEAGAYDVFCNKVDYNKKLKVFICYIGIGMTPPKGYRVALVPRSSLSKYPLTLANSYGVGDYDYTGEYQYRFRDIGFSFLEKLCLKYFKKYFLDNYFPYKKGDRIGQIFIEKSYNLSFVEKETLDITERGNEGFGSTGK